MNALPPPEAAVAAIIIKTAQPEVLLIKRKNNPADPWSGHYAFPGGRRDQGDPSLLDTCFRETYEECGIRLCSDNLVKQYPVHRAGNHLVRPLPVTTYLFELVDHPGITLQQEEISCYEWLPLAYIVDRNTLVRRPMSPVSPSLLFPCIPATEGFVWGFTYEVLMRIIADQYSKIVTGR